MKKVNGTQIVLSLGSNNDAANNIRMAEGMLKNVFSAIRFSNIIVSEAIGMPADCMPFTNAIAIGTTELSLEELKKRTKSIEECLGRKRHTEHNYTIPIDIDILQYGETQFKPSDWAREYNIKLLQELNSDYHN